MHFRSEEEDADTDKDIAENDLVSTSIDDNAERQGKFLLYWMTTTLTSTTTSFTVTQTLKKLECTPAGGFTMSACGK